MVLKKIEIPEKLILIKKYLGKTADVLYVLFFTITLVVSFLGDTKFEIPWKEWMQGDTGYFIINNLVFHTEVILLIILICRYLFSCRYDIKVYLMTFAACWCAFHAYEVRGKAVEEILAFFLLLFGARGFSFRKLMKWYIIVIEILFMITVVASQTGYVENLIYDFEDRNIRISFGFTYPTIFAAHLFFLFLCLWYLAGDRWNLILAILSLLASCLVYIGSEARLSSICFLALAVILVLRKIKIRWMCKQGEHYKMNHIFARVLALTPILCAFMMHMLSLLYSSDIKWMVQLNQLITNRLSLAKKGIEVYGFHLWGSSIPMIGMGGSVETRVNYFYLDSIYIQVSLIAGLVMLGIVLIVLFEAGYKAKASQEWILLWVLAFTGIHCLIEEHLLSIAVCPFLFAASTEVVRKRRSCGDGFESHIMDKENNPET